MNYTTPKRNKVSYLYDYGTVTRTDYVLFEDEIDLVEDIQDFKNSRIGLRSKKMSDNFYNHLRELKEKNPDIYFVSIPSSKVYNNNRLIDKIASELNENPFQLLSRISDIDSAHISGHTSEHYQAFRDTLIINTEEIKKVVLIDDICTSGKTIDICVGALQVQGVEIFDIVVLAKTIERTNLDVGGYTLQISEVAYRNEYNFSLRFNNGGYVRVKNKTDYNYMFNHNARFFDYDYDVKGGYQSLPKKTLLFINIFTKDFQSDFKIIQITYKKSNNECICEHKPLLENRSILYSMKVSKFFSRSRSYKDLIVDKKNNVLQIHGENKIQIGDYVTVQSDKQGICYLLEHVQSN